MPASSVAATRGDSEDRSEVWEDLALATPAPVILAEQVHSWGGPVSIPGTDSDLPSSDDCEGPSTKRRCYTYPPIWQVGIDWTGFSASHTNKSNNQALIHSKKKRQINKITIAPNQETNKQANK